MPTKPAVVGLLKWQLYYRDPLTGAEAAAVQTFWTWRNQDPIPAARVTSERDAIVAWCQQTGWRNVTRANMWCTWLKAWDFSTAPEPTKVMNHRIWPVVAASGNNIAPVQISAVIALRTQPVGSAVRNRLNGRTHHPYPVAPNGQGVWDSSQSGAFVGLYTDLRTRLRETAQADRGRWVVPCWREGGLPRPGGPLLPEVDHVLCRAYPGTVRRRLFHPGPYARGA